MKNESKFHPEKTCIFWWHDIFLDKKIFFLPDANQPQKIHKKLWFQKWSESMVACTFQLRSLFKWNAKTKLTCIYLPGKNFDNSAHLFPYIWWACIRANSSSCVHASLFIEGLRWLCHLIIFQKSSARMRIDYYNPPSNLIYICTYVQYVKNRTTIKSYPTNWQ